MIVRKSDAIKGDYQYLNAYFLMGGMACNWNHIVTHSLYQLKIAVALVEERKERSYAKRK